MTFEILALLVAMLIIGAAIGWTVRGRGLATVARERDNMRDQFNRAVVDLAATSETAKQAESLRVELATARDELRCLDSDRAGLIADRDARTQAFEAQLTQLREAKEQLSAQFSEVGAKLLDQAQRQFLQRADERFHQQGEKSEAQLKALLNPVETTLKRYEEGLQRVEKDRVGTYSELKEAVAQLAQGNALVQRETQRLANVMRSSPKARGRWGEEQLRNILESAGLAENVDFSLQQSVSDGERQLRPDCVINLPGGRTIVVDVKCPLVAFEQAFDEEDEIRRSELLLAHANAMRSYASDLGRKSYWKQFDLSPDFVILFVPGEHFLSAAAERAPDLIEAAFRQGVIIASTINMLALAKVMAGMWRQEALAEQAQAIGALGKELYARLSTMGRHVEKLGKNLSQATGAYNAFVGSLETKVLTQAKRFEDFKIAVGEEPIGQLAMIEQSVRPLSKLPISNNEGDAEYGSVNDA